MSDSEARAGDDELFQPTLRGPDRAHHPRESPWHVSSQAYVAILGGPFAIGLIAMGNTLRLGMDIAQRKAIAVCAGAGVVAAAIAPTLVGSDATSFVVNSVAGAAVYFFAARLQRTAVRAYELHRGDFASLFWPGAGAVFLGRMVYVLTSAVVR